MGATRDNFIKYPRTPHLFGSKGTDDDKHLSRKESEAFIADPSLIVEESIIDASMHAPKGSGSMAGADRTALLLMGMLAVQASLSFFQALSFATAGQRSLVDLRRDTYARLISLPMTFFAQRRVRELASRLSSDLIQIEDTLITILPQFLRQTTILRCSRSSPTTGGTMPPE
jgi:ABC-type multidrug transport system fused ATPase/permease subunit